MSRYARLIFAAAAGVVATAASVQAQISIDQISNSDWNIGNGDLNVVFDPINSTATNSGRITSVAIGNSGNLLFSSDSALYEEADGTPFGAGTQTPSYQIGPNNSYIDFWTSTASTGTSTNPITYAFHYVMFANSPDIACYEVLNHAATDPATSVAQGQFLASVNPSLFTNTYQYNVSVNNPGAQTSVVPAALGQTVYNQRVVQDSTTDVVGLEAGDWGTNFHTKYDESSYIQNLQATVEYGSQYAVSAIFTSEDSMTGGPTKQSLMFTNNSTENTNNIAMIEFLSQHYGNGNYAYVPTQGVATTRVFGPYAFSFNDTDGETGAELYSDAVNSMPTLEADYQTDSELISSGYVPYAQRGDVQISAGNSAGWSSNTQNNMAVLSDPNQSFQFSSNGSQYWTQLSQSGAGTLTDVTPGTYRLSLYELGQWGETRIDGVQVQNGKVDVPQNVQFTPENFGTAAPIWTLGTPDRSSHEFLDGNNDTYTYSNGNATGTPNTTNGVTPGGDLRQFWGSYDYWAQEQSLGNPGKVVYYATAVGSTPATNNPLDWIANQWGTFNPPIYDPNDAGANDEYSMTCPSYVTAGGGPATYKGLPWEIHFTTTQAQLNQGQFVVLSVALAGANSNLTVSLNSNGTSNKETWAGESSDLTDSMIRSGVAGIYTFLVFQFPTSDLLAAGGNNEFQFSVGSSDGVSYDALRMEITNTSANPATTGWDDYDWITGPSTQTNANNAVGLTATNDQVVPEPMSLGALGLGSLLLLRRRTPWRIS